MDLTFSHFLQSLHDNLVSSTTLGKLVVLYFDMKKEYFGKNPNDVTKLILLTIELNTERHEYAPDTAKIKAVFADYRLEAEISAYEAQNC